jgi:AcrR family transcriptional regulator
MTDWSVSLGVAAMKAARKKSAAGRKKAGGALGSGRPAAPPAATTGKREAILAAALEEFSARGFAAARLDDVARRAGVAKGTIYLYFRDKETLFQELLRAELSPVVAALEAMPAGDLPLRAVVERLVTIFAREIFSTRRKDVIRLVLTEGPRFPHIAEFYFREVVERVMVVIRTLAERAVARGELPNDALVRFPQLLGAPGIVAIIWTGLFDRWAKIDVEAFMLAYLDLILARRAP